MARQDDLIEANKRGLLTGQIKKDFDDAVNRGLITLQPQAFTGNPDVPGGGQGSFAQPQPERSLGETLTGVGDAALTAATGATGGALGFGVGSIAGAAGELTGVLWQGGGLELAQ